MTTLAFVESCFASCLSQIDGSPEYANEINRAESFAVPAWEEERRPTLPTLARPRGPEPGALAKAGFYYTGLGDDVKCWWYANPISHESCFTALWY